MTLLIGQAAPDFTAQATNAQTITLSQFRGKKVVLYFYPKDNTPGCTQQGEDFRDHYAAFTDANTVILGVSRDSLAAHEKFKAKYNFPFPLISDPQGSLCNQYAVLKEKSLFGKKYLGIERSTFLIDEKGVLQKIWRNVKVKGHVQEVLATIQESLPSN